MQLHLFAFVLCCSNFMAPAHEAQPAAPQPFALKNCLLTAENLTSNGKISNSKWLTQQQMQTLSLSKIDDAFNADNLYHVFDTLYTAANGKVLLIGREHEFESKAWMATYAPNNHLLDHKLIYFDNAEGFLLVETVVKNDTITIVTLNDYEIEAARKKVEHFKINRHLLLEKAESPQKGFEKVTHRH